VHGFYIEVTNAHVEKIPDDYRRRQTLKNAERYITPELKSFEDRRLSAQERALARERHLYDALLDLSRAGDYRPCRTWPWRSPSSTSSRTSPSAPKRFDLVRPQLTHEPGIDIAAAAISWSSGRSRASSRTTSYWARTGDAHRHRSQHGRQVDVHAADGDHRAACALRHVSCPRASPTIGPLDAIFTRIGAADDLAGGRSTFMVEMTEAAYISTARRREPRPDR
jgi:DNA mismatch repair protein MutS